MAKRKAADAALESPAAGTQDPERIRLERRRSFKVQEELLEAHPSKGALLAISELVREEIIQILGAYLREGWDRGEVISRINEEPGILAREIGLRVGTTVAGILAADEEWPNTVSHVYHRRNEVALVSAEIQSVLHCMHWMNAAAHSRRAFERSKRPGWDHHWLFDRLRAAGCYVSAHQKHWSGAVVDPSISYVIVRRDGSVTKVGVDDSIVEFGPLPVEDRLEPIVTRRLRRSPNAGKWRSEITHQFVNGKWVPIEESEREEQ